DIASLDASVAGFKRAAQEFFDVGSIGREAPVGRALFEYSSLMDGFASVQNARRLRKLSDYEASLLEHTRAAEIFRATVHFGFLSAYVSGCASLETSLELQDSDEAVKGIKNAIALFEQSKLTLAFRDERHPIMTVIDALIKYSISKAFLAESNLFLQNEKAAESKQKAVQSVTLMREHEYLAASAGLPPSKIDYFPISDWKRALNGSFLVSFPESDSIRLANLGSIPAFVETLGNDRIEKRIEPSASLCFQVKSSTKGKIRVVYVDLGQKIRFDEGCLTII
ncbi:MAG: hypothetical protein ACRDF4_01295, partial [Rhabdochlamydiaceae bacterium]